MSISIFILPTVLFALVIASGFWVSKTGKPYSTTIFTLHKLFSLATVVLTVITIKNLVAVTPTQWFINLLIVIAGLSVIALFATGALMSAIKTTDRIWLLIHRVAPFLLAGSMIMAATMLLRKSL